MTRGFYLTSLILFVLGLSTIVLASQTTFIFKHPKTEGVRVVIASNGAAVVAPEYLDPAAAAAKNQAAPKLPRAKFEQKTHNFGVMNPLTEGSHAFTIHNVGTAPLTVEIESTTCKCTVGGVSNKEVPPGESTTVTLQWNTGRNLFFTHGAVVRTNDAMNKSTELVVEGKVRMLVGSDVKELIVPDMEPGRDQAAEFLLYSQMWEEMEVTKVTCGIRELQWQVSEVSPSEVPELDAKVVRRVRITLPGSLASGRFSDNLRISLQRPKPINEDVPATKLPEAERPEAGEETSDSAIETERFELAMHGSVLRRFSLYGPIVRGDGVLDLGDVPQGRRKKFVIRGKIRDSELELGETQIQVSPNFIQAKIEKRTGEGSAAGLYELTLEIPADAPVCQYLGSPKGEVVLRTTHPRLGELRYTLHFAVRP